MAGWALPGNVRRTTPAGTIGDPVEDVATGGMGDTGESALDA